MYICIKLIIDTQGWKRTEKFTALNLVASTSFLHVAMSFKYSLLISVLFHLRASAERQNDILESISTRKGKPATLALIHTPLSSFLHPTFVFRFSPPDRSPIDRGSIYPLDISSITVPLRSNLLWRVHLSAACLSLSGCAMRCDAMRCVRAWRRNERKKRRIRRVFALFPTVGR